MAKTMAKMKKKTAKKSAPKKTTAKKKSPMKKASASKKTAKKTAKKTSEKAAPKSAKTASKSMKKTSTKSTSKSSAKPASRLIRAAEKAIAKVSDMMSSTLENTIGGSKEKALTPTSSNLHTGMSAPLFSLPSDSGKSISLKDYAGKTVVLYFYPKDDTPGCTQQSCDLRDSFTRIQAKGAIVLGISKDSVSSHQKFKSKFSLPFPLLSDESGRTLQAYKVWNEKSMYGKKFMGIDRTTYLIDVNANGQGTIRKAYSKVKVAGHVDEILKDLSSK